MSFGRSNIDEARAAAMTVVRGSVRQTSPATATNVRLPDRLYSEAGLRAEEARVKARLEAERLAAEARIEAERLAAEALNKTSSPGRNWVLWGVGGTVLVGALWWALK